MAELPKIEAAVERVLSLSYPAVTLEIPLARAAGHRLARSVTAKGSQPSRPVALVDGLAVQASDVVAQYSAPAGQESIEEEVAASPVPMLEPADADEAPSMPQLSDERAVVLDEEQELDASFGTLPVPATDEENGERDAEATPLTADAEEAPAHTAASDFAGERAGESEAELELELAGSSLVQYAADGSEVVLDLRPYPPTNRREDALQPGQAIAVGCGSEVPRGADMVYPFAALGLTVEQAARLAPPPPPAADEEAEEERLPVAEPPRDWDLPARFVSGTLALKRLAQRPRQTMLPIGAWARNREVLLQEKSVLRSSEIAFLEALGVEDVEIYRRPVVGVASLGLPFPEAGRQADKAGAGPCPLLTISLQLMRAARVAALPLGYAPLRFRDLLRAVQRWVSQVDILVLVGGSHSGVRGLGSDVIGSAGEVALNGIELQPGGNLTVGRISERPVFALPGSLPDVLAGMVLCVRPLAHKYLTPQLFSSTLELQLENGSRLEYERDTVVPVRYGFDRERGCHTTRFSGRQHDPWLDFIRGQALVVLEGGRRYADGDWVTARLY